MRFIGLLAFSIATALAVPAAAQDESFFSCVEPWEGGSMIHLGLIRSEGDGVVEVYDYQGGQMGEKLGETTVQEGANQDVRVNARQDVSHSIMAQLVVDGEVVASHVYNYCGNR